LGGNVLAMRRLDGMLVRGHGVDRDDHDALEWFAAAAEYGDTDSQVNLGLMYQAGEDYGIEASVATAYYWFTIAVQLGDADAFDLRQSAALDLDSDELEDANQRANAWRAESEDTKANADFDSIVEKFAAPPEPLSTTEPTAPADAETPAS
jgi:TPR repeat protein